MFLGKCVLKTCSKFTGEHPYRSAISIKLVCNFIFRTPFPKNTFEGLPLTIQLFLAVVINYLLPGLKPLKIVSPISGYRYLFMHPPPPLPWKQKISGFLMFLTLSWRGPFTFRNQSIYLVCKSMDWFLYDNGLRYERVKNIKKGRWPKVC